MEGAPAIIFVYVEVGRSTSNIDLDVEKHKYLIQILSLEYTPLIGLCLLLEHIINNTTRKKEAGALCLVALTLLQTHLFKN